MHPPIQGAKYRGELFMSLSTLPRTPRLTFVKPKVSSVAVNQRFSPTWLQHGPVCNIFTFWTFWWPLFPGWHSVVFCFWRPASAFPVDGEFITFQFLFSRIEPSNESPLFCFPQEEAILFFSRKFRTEKTKQMELLPNVILLHPLHMHAKKGGKEGK